MPDYEKGTFVTTIKHAVYSYKNILSDIPVCSVEKFFFQRTIHSMGRIDGPRSMWSDIDDIPPNDQDYLLRVDR